MDRNYSLISWRNKCKDWNLKAIIMRNIFESLDILWIKLSKEGLMVEVDGPLNRWREFYNIIKIRKKVV